MQKKKHNKIGKKMLFIKATDYVKRSLAILNEGQPTTSEDDFEDEVETSCIFN